MAWGLLMILQSLRVGRALSHLKNKQPQILQLIFQEGRDHDLTFNGQKSLTVLFGSGCQSSLPPISLGDFKINLDEVKYWEFILAANLS